MTIDGTAGSELVLETQRLVLRPWRVTEAAVQRELWLERDPRVPPHRRIDAAGHPTLTDFEESIRDAAPAEVVAGIGLLAIERKDVGDAVGYCGLVDSDAGGPGEAELAYELLSRVWGHGYATEAASAILDQARKSGHERVWATVWDWNIASRRVLAKLGFSETGHTESDEVRGRTLFTKIEL